MTVGGQQHLLGLYDTAGQVNDCKTSISFLSLDLFFFLLSHIGFVDCAVVLSCCFDVFVIVSCVCVCVFNKQILITDNEL